MKKEDRVIEEVKYHLHKLCVRYEVPYDSLEVLALPHHLADSILVGVTKMIYGRDLQEIKFPIDWKEAFKARWFPKWLKKRFPIKYQVIKVTAFLPQQKIERETIAFRVCGTKLGET